MHIFLLNGNDTNPDCNHHKNFEFIYGLYYDYL